MGESKKYLDLTGLTEYTRKGEVAFRKFDITGIPTGVTATNIGFLSGKNANYLNGKSYTDILKEILFKEQNATISKNCSTSWADGSITQQTVTVNTTIKDPKVALSFTKGKWSDNTVYAGDPTKYHFSFTDGTTPTSVTGDTATTAYTFNTIVTEPGKVYTFNGSIDYAEGEGAKTTYGNTFSGNKCSAGNKEAGARTITTIWPVYTNSTNTDGSANTEIKTNSNVFEVEFVAETANGGRQKYAYPSGHTLTKLEVYNTLSKEWNEQTLDNNNITTGVTYTINKKDYLYNVYTKNAVNALGAAKMRFTLNKSTSKA